LTWLIEILEHCQSWQLQELKKARNPDSALSFWGVQMQAQNFLHHCSFNWVGVHPAHLPFVAVLLLVNILWDYAICKVSWLDDFFRLDWQSIF
jgi:hypothetical protein